VEPEGVRIGAPSEQGLMYGLMSLIALYRADDGITEAGHVRDWPTIRYRGIHLDLKGYQPKYKRLLEFCTLLAEYRINAILLEVEDKYQYRCAPEVAVPGAYTYDEFRGMSTHCARLGITVIPKLQAIGHVDYILRHERFAHLREATHPFMFCPRNDEAFALWRDMAAELIDCFAEHEFLHIGADETATLGACEVCKPYTKAESYVHLVERCIDYVCEQDKRPIMWEDILRNAHGNLKPEEVRTTWDLGKKAILNYWVYGSESLDMMGPYEDAGMTVWGASAFSGAGPTMFEDVPPVPERFANIAMWTAAAKEHELDGVIATSWTKFRSADPPAESPDASWITLLYAAESMWRGAERAIDDFVSVMSRSFWGIDINDAYGEFILTREAGALPVAPLALAAPRNAERFKLWQAGVEVLRHRRLRDDMHYLLHMYHGMLGRELPDYILDRIRFISDELGMSIERRGAALDTALRTFYEDHNVDEVMACRFGRDALLVEEANALIAKTRLV
jgi:hexosaminidase